MGCSAIEDHARHKKHKRKVKERQISLSFYFTSNSPTHVVLQRDKKILWCKEQVKVLCQTYDYRRKHFKYQDFMDT